MSDTRPGPVKLSGGNIATEWANFEQRFTIYLKASKLMNESSSDKWAILMREAGREALDVYNSFKDSLITHVIDIQGNRTDTDNSESYEHVVAEFRKYAEEKKSLTSSREKFNNRRQKPGEPFANWYTDLKNLIKDCNYGNVADSMLIDRLIWGSNDKRLRESLRSKPTQTLEEAVNMCKTAEALRKEEANANPEVDAVKVVANRKRSHQQMEAQSGESARGENRGHRGAPRGHCRPYYRGGLLRGRGDFYHRGGPPRGGGGYHRGGFQPYHYSEFHPRGGFHYGNFRGAYMGYPQGPFNCIKCQTRHGPRKCPAYGKECYNCGKQNHYEKACQSTHGSGAKKPRVETVNKVVEVIKVVKTPYILDEFDISPQDEVNLLKETSNPSVDMVSVAEDSEIRGLREYTETLKLQGKYFVNFKLDCGSEANLIPFDVYCHLNAQNEFPLTVTPLRLEAFNQTSSAVEGVFTALTETKHGAAREVEYTVTKACKRPILGIQQCYALNLVRRVSHSVDAAQLGTGPASKEEFIKANKDVFEGLGQFKQTIRLEVDNSIPAGMCPPRRYSVPIAERLKVKLDSLVKQGIVEKVKGPMPKFISNLVIREKKDGDLRLCLDPQMLNKALIKQKYPIPTLDEISCKVRDKSVFTVLDLKDGFWHASLDAESSLLCSFATPFGIYKFNKLPFGISCAPELFQYLTDQVFGDTGGIVYFDDILIPGKDLLEHDLIVGRVLEKARSENVKFNPNKIQYRKSEVMFLGLLWAKNQIRIDPERTRAIQALKAPKTRHMLQKVVGTFNHLRKFIPQMGSISAPLCELLSSAVTFQWLPVHEEAFQKLKDCVSNAPVLVPFDHTKPLTVQTDASQDGLGAVLLQDGKLVACASRKLTEYECNYAQIEKEMVGLYFGADRFKPFIYGMPNVKFQTDHQPLVSIFKKPIHKITNNRLKKLRLKMMIFNPEVEYLPGKYMFLADLLSRNCIQDPVEDDPEMVEVVHEVTANLSIAPGVMAQLKVETEKDVGLKSVKNYYQQGWPKSKNRLVPEALPYWKLRNDIFVEDSLVIHEDKVITPPSLRVKVLNSLHAAHQGVEKTKARARQVVYWPGISNDIKTLLAECRVCERYSAANFNEPLIPHKVPELRFQKVSADILEFMGQPFLVVVDNFSKWLEVRLLSSKSSSSVIAELRTIFSTHGIPEVIFGDNNPFNSYECRSYAESIGSSIITSSPEYPRSNGLAEKGVHIAKQLLKKSRDSDTHYLDTLREYNNTPLTGMSWSPAQILMSRMCRTIVPTRPQQLEPRVVQLGAVQTDSQTRVKEQHDRRARRKPVEFAVGEAIVFWRNRKWYKGTVVEKLKAPRSYLIKQLSGRVLRRNTWHLRKSRTRSDRLDEPPVDAYDFETQDRSHVLQRAQNPPTPQIMMEVPQPQLAMSPHHGRESELEEDQGPRVPHQRQRQRGPRQRRGGRGHLAAPVIHWTRRGRPIRMPARYLE